MGTEIIVVVMEILSQERKVTWIKNIVVFEAEPTKQMIIYNHYLFFKVPNVLMK